MSANKFTRKGARGQRSAPAGLIHEPAQGETPEVLGSQGVASALPPVVVDIELVERLFGSSGEDQGSEVPDSAASIPPGFHDYSRFSRALESDDPFTGLVAHIAMNNVPGSEEITSLVPELAARLLRPSDFGCRLAEDEFLIICPDLVGIEARNRLESISQLLWRFQSDLMGRSTSLFSWGSVEARDERLLDAVTGATERMLQTRHQFKSIPIDAITRRRRAV